MDGLFGCQVLWSRLGRDSLDLGSGVMILSLCCHPRVTLNPK